MGEVRCSDGKYECPHCRVWMRLPPDGALPARCGNPVCKGVLPGPSPSARSRAGPGPSSGGTCILCQERGADRSMRDGREHHARCYERLTDLHAELEEERASLLGEIAEERECLEGAGSVLAFLIGVVTGTPFDAEAARRRLRGHLDRLEEVEADRRELEEALADVHAGYREG